MDYDDTDFQSQNFQLAGEDNSKFPSGLRQFPLPKLDIDDQLQSHLRFDNLIDSEGLFSVQGHSSSWIEVLSTGSSVVDFSSSAAESCSINRTNNVWSEATSTESVEMLLKSVGENEMTGKMDDNVHHQIGGMDNQTDPSNTQPKSSSSLLLESLSGTNQHLGTSNLTSEAGNALLLESSDGLLEAITNPVKMLHMSDDTSKRASALQPSFLQAEHAAEGTEGSADRSCEPDIKKFGAIEEPNSAKFHQPEPDLTNSNPCPLIPLPTKKDESIQSPKGKHPAHATIVPEETKADEMADVGISTSDESKHGMLGQHQDSVDNLRSGVMEEKTTMEEISAISGNIVHLMKSGKKATISTSATEDKFDSSDNLVDGNSPASLLDEKDLSISSISHELSFKEGATPALEDDPVNQPFASPNSVHQEKKPALFYISRNNIDSGAVTDTLNAPKDKPDCSESIPPNDSSVVLLDEKISSMNHEGPLKEDDQSELGDHNIASSVSEHPREGSGGSANLEIDAVCSSSPVTVAETPQREEQAISGDHQGACPQKFQNAGPSMQLERCEDLVAPSSAFVVSLDKAEQKIGKTPLNGVDDLSVQLQENKTDLAPGTGSGNCTDATCGSPTVISSSEPCPEEHGQGSNTLLHYTQTEPSKDTKDHTVATDNSHGSTSSSINIIPIPTLEETNTTEDKSFSFEVGAPPNISEKVHNPAWSPLPRSEAAHSSEATTKIPRPRNPSKNTCDDGKKMSTVETGKEQKSGRKVVETAEGPSVSSHNGHSTKTKSTPLEQAQQHPTPDITALGHQPFTDLQHVQLRAQIFVYGALIQGIPPAEAYMVSAFGDPVCGGKPAWETIWRVVAERFQSQKSPSTGLETPTSSRIGSRAAEKASKDTAVKTTPASKKGGKTVLPAHTPVPLHLPTFNMSALGSSTLNLQRGTHLDFSQAVSPVLPYSSQMRQPTSGVTSWFPQSPGPRPAPWLVPPQNLIFDSSMQPVVPSSTNETAKGAPSKNISILQAVSPAVFPPSQTPTVSPLAVIHEEKKKASSSTLKRGTTPQRSRKRKKAPSSPEQKNPDNSSQLKADIASVTPATQHAPGFTLSTHSPINILGSGVVSNTGLITSAPNYQVTGNKDMEQRIVFSEQISSAIEQSMGQAKGAGVHMMEAVKHAEGIWSHLSANSSGKLPADIEEKLASAAAAASVAVSVAKAAAEAAKMASEAALQANMMAEEVLSSSSVNSLQKHDTGEFEVSNNMGSLSSFTPTSSWKIKDSVHAPASIISVAREVARKRVEEASAAAKQAENLDAILKAAELAAEAVFKAGTIIAMGEPLPFTLSELLEAGPDGYWKSDKVMNKKTVNAKNIPLTEQLEVPSDFSKSGRKCDGKAKYDLAIQNSGLSSGCKELQLDEMQSGNRVENVPTNATMVPLHGNKNDTAPSIIWNGIGKGSAVEVLANKDGFGVAWFSAKVLDINEDSACISYDSHTEETVLGKEWVPLKQEGQKAPQIRLAHPATVSRFKGTRKRRRDTTGNYSWAIGDHVDAWIRDSWREGIISQSCEGDETKFSVQFSGSSDSLVDAWNLRPSLVWKDEQWREMPREKKVNSNKGDSPREKRQRTKGSDHVPIGGEVAGPSMDKSTNTTKPEEPKPLALSHRDMVFNIGKSVVENKTDGVAFKRPGLRKEGSRVVGVPKPGKKKKFMEVSKHYDADQTGKISEGNASTRAVKHLVPPVPRPREGTCKGDQKGKRIGGIRSRGLKSTKSQDVATNSIPGKGPSSMSVPSTGVFESSYVFAGSMPGPSDTVNFFAEKNISAHGIGSRAEDASGSELHMQATSTGPTSKNLTTTERAKRKRLPLPSMDNLNRSMNKTSEIPGKMSSDSTEPRRSNRRIQPTSRLLEGLQSSLIVSKVPSEKGPRTNYRSAASRGRTLG